MDPEETVASNTLAEQATEAACTMLEVGLKARAKRFESIKKNEDAYQGVTGSALKGRNNVPFDCFVMGGFIDTLISGLNEPIAVQFGPKREQDKKSADMVTAAFERESAQDNGAWNDKIMGTKFLASLAGRGFVKMYCESVPKFRSDMSVCDHYDMVTEAKGGGYLDNHLYKFQMNIFRTADELREGATGGFYDKTQIRLIMNRYAQNADTFKRNEDLMNSKNLRWQSAGIDTDLDSYVGSLLYRLTEGVINFKGKWYYIVFSYETKTWVRFDLLENVFEHAKKFPGRGPWLSYATHPHPFLFWTKAPADDVRPVGYTMKKIVNLTLDNLEKRNWDMTAYDPKIFTDPSQFLYRQDGLIKANTKGGDIRRGIFKMETPDTTSITINMVEWLNNFIGQKTGITADAQGSSSQDKVGIYYGNMQAVSKRMMLANQQIHRMYVDMCSIFDYGLYQHLREPYAIKLIGNNGVRWEEEITRKDTEKDFTITITSKMEEAVMNTAKDAKRQTVFQSIERNPALMSKVNPNWYLREKLKDAGYNDEQTRVAIDTMNDGDEEVMAKAAESIQKCLDGEEYIEEYRAATSGFIQKIIDFANDNFPLIPEEQLSKMRASEIKRYNKRMETFDKLVAYANLHIPIAQANMQRKLVSVISQGGPQQGFPMPAGPMTPAAPAAPIGQPASPYAAAPVM